MRVEGKRREDSKSLENGPPAQALFSPLGGEHYLIVGNTLPRKTPAFLAALLSSVCLSSTHKTGFSSGLWTPQSGIICLPVSPPPPALPLRSSLADPPPGGMNHSLDFESLRPVSHTLTKHSCIPLHLAQASPSRKHSSKTEDS